MPRSRPAAVMPASRCAAAGPGAAASTTAAACGPSSPSAVRARRTIMASASSSAASSAGGTKTPRMGGWARCPGGAGEEPGGVGGGDDDLGWRAVGAAWRPGQQAGQDGPGGGWCPRAGQAEAAEGGGVGGDLLAVADADGYRAGRGRTVACWPGGCREIRRAAGGAARPASRGPGKGCS